MTRCPTQADIDALRATGWTGSDFEAQDHIIARDEAMTTKIEPSSGCVFNDLGIENPATTQIKDGGPATELEKLRAFAKEATIALTNLAGGGSELFGGCISEIYIADVPFCIERIRNRQLRDRERTKSAIRAARSEREQNVPLSLWKFADEAQNALGWSYDIAEIDKVRDAATKECSYDATLEFTESVMRIANSRLERRGFTVSAARQSGGSPR